MSDRVRLSRIGRIGRPLRSLVFPPRLLDPARSTLPCSSGRLLPFNFSPLVDLLETLIAVPYLEALADRKSISSGHRVDLGEPAPIPLLPVPPLSI